MLHNKIKFQKNVIFLILNVILWILIFFSSNSKTFADIHEQTLSELINHSSHKISGIPVKNGPIFIESFGNKLYVANSGDNTVSVIDANNNTKIKDIPVGGRPIDIAINTDTNTVYVANYDDNIISAIDPITSQAIGAKVMFNVEPFNSGHIECDNVKSIVPTLQQFYLYSGSKCTAKPSQGFEFVSWEENLKGNSTQLFQVVPAPSIWDSILDIFHIKPDKPEATLNITKFGIFTANFKALPPPIPAEYIATLFSVVVTAFVGTWLTPTVIAWRKTKNQGKILDYYFHKINSLQDDGRLDDRDIDKLDSLRKTITNEYTKGKINKEQFDKLIDEISINYNEIFKNQIDSLNNQTQYSKGNGFLTIRSSIEDAYTRGKLNELHYNLLNEKITNYKK